MLLVRSNASEWEIPKCVGSICEKLVQLRSANTDYANRKLGLARLNLGFTWLTFDLAVIIILFVESLPLSVVVVPFPVFSKPNSLPGDTRRVGDVLTADG